MKTKTIFLILLIVIASCGKDDKSEPPELHDQLPAVTQSGANTFGCLLDGEVWLPKHYSNSIVNPPVVLYASWYHLKQENGYRLSIGADRRRQDDLSPKEDIILYTGTDSIEIKRFLDVSFLEDSVAKSGVIYTYEAFKNGPYAVYRSVLSENSWVYFSLFDSINRIASGTFSVDLVNVDNDQDTVQIRDGRFDLPF